MQEKLYNPGADILQRTRVAVLDENKNVREMITQLLKTQPMFEIVGVFSSTRNFIANIIKSDPDVLVMEIEGAGMKGLDILGRLGDELPHLQVLVQTVCEEDKHIFMALKAGACGYILKSDLRNRLIVTIKEMRAEGASMSPRILRRVIGMLSGMFMRADFHTLKVDYGLTSREKDVLDCIIKGKSHKIAALELNISYETIRTHVKNIYSKLQVNSSRELIAKTLSLG